MTVDAEAASVAASRGSESFQLWPDELRFVADWVSPAERIWVELPGDVADLIHQRRGEATPMLLCTWTPDCDQPGAHRMERGASTPGLTVVETVCDRHTDAARREGYEHRVASAGRGNTGPRS